MNSSRKHYRPVIGYTLLLVAVWLFSWLADIAATFFGSDLGVSSLVCSEGARWAVRNAVPSLDTLPWGCIIIAIAAAGLLHGAGIMALFSHLVKRKKLTKNELRSIVFAVSALLLYAAILYVATVSPWNILGGVTGSVANSPLIDGMPLLLFLGVLIVATVYGFMYGNYRSPADVASSLGSVFPLFVPALLALVPAAGIVASLDYMGVFALLGITTVEKSVMVAVFYSIPFLHAAMAGKREGEK